MMDENKLLGTIERCNFTPSKDHKPDMIYYFGKWVPAYTIFPMRKENHPPRGCKESAINE